MIDRFATTEMNYFMLKYVGDFQTSEDMSQIKKSVAYVLGGLMGQITVGGQRNGS